MTETGSKIKKVFIGNFFFWIQNNTKRLLEKVQTDKELNRDELRFMKAIITLSKMHEAGKL
ncbi:MAG: hypothetical protein EPO24_07650 [Bacteroidetes bacterium]|nr:MAG: hypothetical protein EPO24_07650 [Bacteroidota bacterium]